MRVRVLDNLAQPGQLPIATSTLDAATACAMRVATPLAPTLPTATWLRLTTAIAGTSPPAPQVSADAPASAPTGT